MPVMAARHEVDEPFAVIGADDFFGFGTFRALYEHLAQVDPESENFAMAGFTIENTVTRYGHVSRGVCTAQDGYLCGVTERTYITLAEDGRAQYSLDRGVTNIPIPRGSIVSMNTWAFTPRIFRELEAGFPPVIDRHVRSAEGGVLSAFGSRCVDSQWPCHCENIKNAGALVWRDLAGG